MKCQLQFGHFDWCRASSETDPKRAGFLFQREVKQMRKILHLIFGMLLLVGLAGPMATPALADSTCANVVKVQLGIILDGTSSVSDSNFTAQKNGLADAISDSSCVPHDGTVELTVVQMGGSAGGPGATLGARLELGEPRIIDASNYSSTADEIRDIPKISGAAVWTPMACAIYLVADTMYGSDCFDTSNKQVINIITDGVPNACCTSTTPGLYSFTTCCGNTSNAALNGCEAARISAYDAREYALDLLGMRTDPKDEFDAEGFDSSDTPGVPLFSDNSTGITNWFITSIVWPQPGGLYTGTGDWPSPGWVYQITDNSNIGKDFKNAICHKVAFCNCDDNDPCTIDTCDNVTGLCAHTPVVCQPCYECDPSTGG